MSLHSVMLLNITTDMPRVEYYEIFQMLRKQNKGIHHGGIFLSSWGVFFCFGVIFDQSSGKYLTHTAILNSDE